MQPRDLALLRVPSDPSVTPDGSVAAVAVTRIDLEADAYRSEIWVVPTDGSAPPRRFTNGPRDMRPRWSPDGRWLAFIRAPEGGKPQLHVMPADGGEPRRVCEHPLGVGDIVWSPDSTRIAYTARVPEPGRYGTDPEGGEYKETAKEPPRRITTLRYRLDGVGFTIDRRPHVFVVDALADDAEPVQVTRGDYDHADPAWSPDGQQLAFVSARHDGWDADFNADVFVAPPTGGDARRVTRGDLAVARPAFSPDGGTILFVSAGPGTTEFAGRNAGVWAVPADGSEPPRRLTETEPWDVDPLITGGSELALLTEEPGTVVTVALNRGANDLVAFPTGGGEPTRLLTAGARQVTGYARAGGTTVAVVTADVSAGELVALGGDGDAPERVLTNFGGELSRTASLRPMTELDAAAPDGGAVHGWIVKPAGTGPFPVLLNIHGGPFSQYGYFLFDEAQVYAGAGYAVVLGNPRGSASYGEAHGRAIVGDMGKLDRDDLLALLDAALDDPDLDADRVGVMGGSYGGFMTTWLAAHDSARFRAAISERAVNAWDSFTGTSDIGFLFTDAYCGPDPARQQAQSPLTHAHRISIPMLLIHSEEDWRCPVEQAQRLFVQLKRNGFETEMLLFPGEGHELSRSGLPSHRVARFDAILAWWERHLKPTGSPAATLS